MKKINITVSIILSFMLIVPPSVMAEGIGTITFIEGRVDMLADGAASYLPLVVGEEISLNEAVRTKSYSKAEITLKDGSIIRLGDASQIKVGDYEVDDKGNRKTGTVELERGKMRAIVRSTKDKAPFNITTPNATGVIKGSDIFLSYQQSATNVLVTEGTFSLANPAFPEQMIDVKEGMASLVPYNAPPGDARVFLPTEKNRYEDMTGAATYKMKGSEKNKNLEFTRATVESSSGTVSITPLGSKTPHASTKNEVLNVGDKIETGENGRARVICDNGLVIELKENSQLIITRLTRDPKTGNYQSVFESKYGKIISKLQNMPKKSTFAIKTPHATCGIRGTIMYLEILQTGTKAFFEGGTGYVESMGTGATKVIKEGITSSTDAEGNTTESTTTDADRSGFSSGFGNEGENEYGYTDPGETGTGDTGLDPGLSGGDVPPDTGGGTDVLFDEIKTGYDTSGDSTGGDIPGTAITAVVEGKYGYYGSFQSDPDSWIVGTITCSTSLAPWAGVSSLTSVDFTSSNPNERKLFFSEMIGSGDDGGALYGRVVGAGLTPEGTENVTAAIYVDSSNVAGVMFTQTAISPDMFFNPAAESPVLPEELEGSIVVDESQINFSSSFLDSDGYFNAEGDLNLLSIKDQPWGIWEGIFAAEYDRPEESSNWWGTFGGKAGDGYTFGILEGVDDLEGFLHIDVVATFMDHYSLNALYGTVVGTYEEANSYYYEGVGAGGWIEADLTFTGVWGTQIEGSDLRLFSSLYYNNEGGYSHLGEDYGLIGGVVSPWDSASSVTAMGRYNSEGENRDGSPAYVWNTPVSSYNAGQENYTTLDGGAFWGITGTAWNNGNIVGSLAAMYADPYGGMGLFRGNINGAYHSAFDMWITENIFMPEQKKDPHGMAESISLEWFYMYIYDYGSSDVTLMDIEFGEMQSTLETAEDGYGNFYFLASGSEISQTWGIFDLNLSGTFNAGESSMWQNRINGSGYFGYYDSAGSMEGDVFGTYSTEEEGQGTWFATSIGTWSSFDAETETLSDGEGEYYGIITGLLLDDDTIIGKMAALYAQPFGDVDVNYGQLESDGVGHFGGQGTLVADYFKEETIGFEDVHRGVWGFMSSGSYAVPESADSLWTMALGGFSSSDNDGNDGFWGGLIKGTKWADGLLEGKFMGLWVDSNNGEGENPFSWGQVSGEVVGKYVEDDANLSGEWEAVGAGEWVEAGDLLVDLIDLSELTQSLQDLSNFVEPVVAMEALAGIGYEGITDAVMDIAFYGEDQMGIWAAMINGTYDLSAPPSSQGEWGINFDNISENVTIDLVGTEWQNDEWTATVTGEVGDNMLVGSAAGTFDELGNFSGVGAGAWGNEEGVAA